MEILREKSKKAQELNDTALAVLKRLKERAGDSEYVLPSSTGKRIISTTYNTYIHVIKEKKQDVVELLVLRQGPTPPMACLDFETTMKFYESAVETFGEGSAGLKITLDWMLRILLSSLVADSASRIFDAKNGNCPI